MQVPKVLAGRPDAWHTDEEFGRQTLAGVNPCVIKALTQTPESLGSAIRGEHINGARGMRGLTNQGEFSSTYAVRG